MRRLILVGCFVAGVTLGILAVFAWEPVRSAFKKLDSKDWLTAAGFGVTVLIWLGTRIWDLRNEANDRKRELDQALQAVYAEIEYNVTDLRYFLKKGDSQVVEDAVRLNRTLIPHITDARHTRFYERSIGELRSLSGEAIGTIVVFYSDLEKITAQIAALHQESFKTISDSGRAGAIATIWTSAKTAVRTGTLALEAIDGDRPDMKRERLKR